MRWAVSVAERTRAEVVAISAWQPAQAELPPDEFAREHAARGARVSRTLDRVAGDTPHRIEVIDGDRLAVLVDEQNETGGELLVVGLPGDAGSARRLGTTTEVLARRITAPLAAVPVAGGAQLERVVVGLDGSDSSTRAARWCASFASAVGAEVVATSVVTPELEGLSSLDGKGISGWLGLQTHWIAPLRDAGVSTRVAVVRDADIAMSLVRTAERERADAIVVGLERRAPAIHRRLLRNAARLLHKTSVTVVLVG
jgi:K+-sensing histidine kinase KdpD